ncbi:nose resistant to fluoxetine protein 6-like, partial [Nilaparvata lugens]|uniref:nose resistant to fluoxetine protein 6-like n=1 Tax=Nilaparvata lugens TaxID=108931 RepID=UPI00193DD8ED
MWGGRLCGHSVLLTLYKGAVVYYYKYSTLLFYGISVSMIGDGGDDIYLNPIHRLTPYLIGVMFGYILQEMKPQHRKLSWEKQLIGWSGCLVCLYYAYFAMAKAAKRGYTYSESEAALFGMAQPLLWCPAICWIIYACQTQQAGVVSKMLEWKGFVIFSRISYPFYLVQIMIIFWSVTDVKAPQQRSLLYFIDLNEFAGLIVLSAIFSLFFLLPLKDLFNSVKGAKATKTIKVMEDTQTAEKSNSSPVAEEDINHNKKGGKNHLQEKDEN